MIGMSYPTSINHPKAVQLISEQLQSASLKVESCEVKNANGRVISKPVRAPINVPEYDCSRMDGYAINLNCLAKASVSNYTLAMGQAIHATAQHEIKLCDDLAIPVMTGAVLPADANAIVLKEQAEVKNNYLHFDQLPKIDNYIRKVGSDTAVGQIVMDKGQKLRAAHLGVLSALGISAIEVIKKPKVALMMTGDELIQAGETCKPGQIYDANSAMLSALLVDMGCEVKILEAVKDTEEAVFSEFMSLRNSSFDFIISVGGVSMGDKDFIPLALQKYGEVVFHKVHVKPGFPMLFGRLSNAMFYGLPGNPVSAYSTLCQYLFPAIHALRNNRVYGKTQEVTEPVSFTAVLKHQLNKTHSRREFMRGNFNSNGTDGSKFEVEICGGQQSSRIGSLADANCFVVLSEEPQQLKAGDLVTFQPFSQFKD